MSHINPRRVSVTVPMVIRAVLVGQLSDVKAVVSKHGRASLEAVNRQGQNALYVALEKGLYDIAEWLVEIGCPLEVTTRSGDTVLRRTKQTANPDIMKIVFGKLWSVCLHENGVLDLTNLRTNTVSEHTDMLKSFVKQRGPNELNTIVIRDLICASDSLFETAVNCILGLSSSVKHFVVTQPSAALLGLLIKAMMPPIGLVEADVKSADQKFANENAGSPDYSIGEESSEEEDLNHETFMEEDFATKSMSLGTVLFDDVTLEGFVLEYHQYATFASHPLQFLLNPIGSQNAASMSTLAIKLIHHINKERSPNFMTTLARCVDDMGRTALRVAVDRKNIAAVEAMFESNEDGLFKPLIRVRYKGTDYEYQMVYDVWCSKVPAADNLTPLQAAIISVRKGMTLLNSRCHTETCVCHTLPPIKITPYADDRTSEMLESKLNLCRALLKGSMVDRHVAVSNDTIGLSNTVKVPLPTARELQSVCTNLSWIQRSFPLSNSSTVRHSADMSRWFDRIGVRSVLHGRHVMHLVLQYAPELAQDLLNLGPLLDIHGSVRAAAKFEYCPVERIDVVLDVKDKWRDNGGMLKTVMDCGLGLVHWACLRRQSTLLSEMYKIQALSIDALSISAALQWTAFHYAAYSGSTECLQVLLKHTQPPSLIIRESPMHVALGLGHVNVVHMLVDVQEHLLTEKTLDGVDCLDIAIFMREKHERNTVPKNSLDWKHVQDVTKHLVDYVGNRAAVQPKLYRIAISHFTSQAAVYALFTLILTLVAFATTQSPSFRWQDREFLIAKNVTQVNRFLQYHEKYLGTIETGMTRLGAVRVEQMKDSSRLSSLTHTYDTTRCSWYDLNATATSVVLSANYRLQSAILIATLQLNIHSSAANTADFTYLNCYDFDTWYDIILLVTQLMLLIFVYYLFKEEVIDLTNAFRRSVQTARGTGPAKNRQRIQEAVSHFRSKFCGPQGRLLLHLLVNEARTKLEEEKTLEKPAWQVLAAKGWEYTTYSCRVVWYGLQEYLSREWNTVDLLCIFLWVLAITTQLQLYTIVSPFVCDALELRPDESSFHAFPYATALKTHRSLILTLLVVLSWFKLLKYIQVLPTIGPVVTAIVTTVTSPNIAIFLFVFLEVTFSFVCGFYFLFRSNAHGRYETVLESSISVFRLVVGDFDYNEMSKTHDVLGPVMFTWCMVACRIILLNIFIAVVGNVYESNLQQCQSNWSLTIVEVYAQQLLSTADLHMALEERAVISKPVVERVLPFVEEQTTQTSAMQTAVMNQEEVRRDLAVALRLHDKKMEVEHARRNLISGWEAVRTQHGVYSEVLADINKLQFAFERLSDDKQQQTVEEELKEEIKNLKQTSKDNIAAGAAIRKKVEAAAATLTKVRTQVDDLQRQVKDSTQREERLRESVSKVKANLSEKEILINQLKLQT